MSFQFTRRGLSGRARLLQRAFEILPGATSWTILVGMVVLAFWRPLVASVLVIALLLYWLLRLLYLTLFLVLSYARLAIEQDTDWTERIRALDRLIEGETDGRDHVGGATDLKQRFSDWLYRKEVDALTRSRRFSPPSSALYHLVILPIVRERRAIVEPGLVSLAQQPLPTKRLLVVLALEARADAHVQADAQALQRDYQDRFLEVLLTVHPDGLPGEARVKGANVTYAAQRAAAFFAERQIPLERVVVSCFDADTVVSPGYLACLTYRFMVCPDRTRASFQPIPVYHNNIWEVPGFARVLDIGSSFFQLIEATNPATLVTFSSHSMSFQALVEVGYWPVDFISDDSAIFWKAFLHFEGRYRVVPMYSTVSMDVTASASWRQAIANVYRQKRRWAWGVENFPIVMRGFLAVHRIPRLTRLRHAFKLFENHVAWATWGFLLTIIGWLPVLMAQREFSDTVLYYTAPRVTAVILNLASLSLVTTIVLSQLLLPRPRMRFALLKRIGLALEWLLLPFVVTWLGALPALDAQTRLMCGKYLEFWVAEKRRQVVVRSRAVKA